MGILQESLSIRLSLFARIGLDRRSINVCKYHKLFKLTLKKREPFSIFPEMWKEEIHNFIHLSSAQVCIHKYVNSGMFCLCNQLNYKEYSTINSCQLTYLWYFSIF